MNWLKHYKSCILVALIISLVVGCISTSFFKSETFGSDIYTNVLMHYNSMKGAIQNAVTAYIWDHDGERPPHEGNYNISVSDYGYKECDVINICSLIRSLDWKRPEALPNVPDGCYGDKGEAGTNFYSEECDNSSWAGEYVWLMDGEGQVYSTCIGNLCDANNADGYQGVWLGFHYDPPPTWWSEHWKGAAALISITVLVFFISLFFCVRYSAHHQPPDKPTGIRGE